MSRAKLVVSVLLVALLLASLCGCQMSNTATSEPSANEQVTTGGVTNEQASTEEVTGNDSKPVIGIVMINFTNPFYISYMETAKECADVLGVELIIKSAEGSLESEIALVENFIQQGVDCIMADPIDAEGVKDVYVRAADAGIPMVSLFNAIDTGGKTYSCTWDHYGGFKAVTAAMCEYLGGEGNICVIQGGIGNWVNSERTRGFEDAVKEYPNINLLSMQPCDWDPSKAVEIMQNWLITYDDIDAVLVMTDGATPSIVEIVEASGREIAVAGNDGEMDVLKLMQENKVKADCLLGSKRGGWMSIIYANKLINKEPVDLIQWISTPLVVTPDLKTILEGSAKDFTWVKIITPDEGVIAADAYREEFKIN